MSYTVLVTAPDLAPSDRAKHERVLSELDRTEWMCAYYVRVGELARRLTEWSMSRIGPVRRRRGSIGCWAVVWQAEIR